MSAAASYAAAPAASFIFIRRASRQTPPRRRLPRHAAAAPAPSPPLMPPYERSDRQPRKSPVLPPFRRDAFILIDFFPPFSHTFLRDFHFILLRCIRLSFSFIIDFLR
jgi:hypothetical protein